MDKIPEGAIPVDQFRPAQTPQPQPQQQPQQGEETPPPGAIPVDQFKPQQQPEQDEETPPPGAIPVDQFRTQEEFYNTPSQQLKTAAEGLGEGLIGPAAPYLEKKILGVKAEDILNRQQAHPYIKGGAQIAGLFSPVGEGAALAKVGATITKAFGLASDASLLAKIGVKTVSQAAEMGLFQAGDEVSKMIKEDPQASAESAIAHVETAAALGGAFGATLGAVSPLFKVAIGDKVRKFLEDFKGEANFRLDNPDLHEAFTNELNDYYTKTSKAFDSTWGFDGIKSQAVEKLAPELNDKIIGQTNDFLEKSQNLVDEMKSNPNRYPAYLVDKVENSLSKYAENAKSAQSSSELFQATNQFKRELQGLSKFDKQVLSISPEFEFLQSLKGIGRDLRVGLEDKDVWGKAGEVQQKINAAASKYFDPLKDFEKAFATTLNGEKIIDPGKTNTFINQFGDVKATIKTQKLKNFVDASEEFRNELSKIHEAAGIENTVEPASTAIIGHLLDKPTAGSKLAAKLVEHGLSSIAGKTAGSLVGGYAGSFIGHPEIGGLIGGYALGPMFSSVLPGLTKPILENETSVNGAKAAIDYAVNVMKGETALNRGVAGIFKPGTEVIASKNMPDDKDRERIDNLVQKVNDDPNSLIQNQPGHLGHYLPDHQAAVGMTTTKVMTYLNQLKPRATRNSPLDANIDPTPAEEARYKRALDIAVNPDVVMKHIKDGTLQTTDLQDLQNMFPNRYQRMCGKLTNEIAGLKEDNRNIPYKTKIALSLCLGQPLDSSMSPQSIVAAQPQPKPQPQQQPQGKTKKGTSTLGKSNHSYQTQTQAAESDRNGRND